MLKKLFRQIAIVSCGFRGQVALRGCEQVVVGSGHREFSARLSRPQLGHAPCFQRVSCPQIHRTILKKGFFKIVRSWGPEPGPVQIKQVSTNNASIRSVSKKNGPLLSDFLTYSGLTIEDRSFCALRVVAWSGLSFAGPFF